MSQVDDFHMHDFEHEGRLSPVPVPGTVYECDDHQCATERKVIEGMSDWPQDQLDRQIAAYEDRVNKHLDTLIRLRLARERKRKLTNQT